MLVVTHFSIPFFSYLIAENGLKNLRNRRTILVQSCIVGVSGIIPDITNIHFTLSARHDSLSHTVWSPLVMFVLTILATVFFFKSLKSFIFWLPFAVSIHLFLDAISGGIRLFYPSSDIIGKYYISPALWGLSEVCFLLLLFVTYKYNFKNSPQKAEHYI